MAGATFTVSSPTTSPFCAAWRVASRWVTRSWRVTSSTQRRNTHWVSALGVSQGDAHVELARYLREYWRQAGFRIVVRHEDGYRVEGPDFMVLRLSLVALSESRKGDLDRLAVMHSVLSRSRSPLARQWADFTLHRAKERLVGDSVDKRYVNVVGGPSDSADLRTVAAELTRAGFGDWLAPMAGPLLLSTKGESAGYSFMPIQPGSTYDVLHDVMDDAFRMANESSPDPELDLRGLAKPLWGHHSARRAADTFARQSRESTGATERDIDIVFGWQEALYSAQMQLHYESHFDRERRAAVTSQI